MTTPLSHRVEIDGVDPAVFRQVLGHFCTGVTIVTSLDDDGAPAGFASDPHSKRIVLDRAEWFGRLGGWPSCERAANRLRGCFPAPPSCLVRN